MHLSAIFCPWGPSSAAYHGAAWLGFPGLIGIPHVSVPIYPASAVAIDRDTVPCQYKPRTVVLEGNRVRVVSPVREVVRKLRWPLLWKDQIRGALNAYFPRASPLNYDVVDYWVQSLGDPVLFSFRESDKPRIAALVKRAHDIGDIVCLVAMRSHHAVELAGRLPRDDEASCGSVGDKSCDQSKMSTRGSHGVDDIA